MIDYDIDIETAIKSKLYNFSNIHDFRDTPNELLFNRFYSFCRENLNNQSKKIEIKPNFFIFSTEFPINARATKTADGIYGIKINLGLFHYCIDNLSNNNVLNPYIQKKYPEVYTVMDNPPSVLSFQIATQFTYYHELAHLMQFTKSADRSLSLEERAEDSSNYSIENHKLEINADTYASIAIASHIQQYAENIFGDTMDQSKIEILVKILLSSLLNYIATFSNDLSKVYLNEKSHPHPFLRLFNIGLNVAHYLNESKFLQQKNMRLNMYELTRGVFDFYEELEENKVYKTNFREALDYVYNMQEDIVNYLGELINFDLPNYNNALDLWNEQIVD